MWSEPPGWSHVTPALSLSITPKLMTQDIRNHKWRLRSVSPKSEHCWLPGEYQERRRKLSATRIQHLSYQHQPGVSLRTIYELILLQASPLTRNLRMSSTLVHCYIVDSTFRGADFPHFSPSWLTALSATTNPRMSSFHQPWSRRSSLLHCQFSISWTLRGGKLRSLARLKTRQHLDFRPQSLSQCKLRKYL